MSRVHHPLSVPNPNEKSRRYKLEEEQDDDRTCHSFVVVGSNTQTSKPKMDNFRFRLKWLRYVGLLPRWINQYGVHRPLLSNMLQWEASFSAWVERYIYVICVFTYTMSTCTFGVIWGQNVTRTFLRTDIKPCIWHRVIQHHTVSPRYGSVDETTSAWHPWDRLHPPKV